MMRLVKERIIVNKKRANRCSWACYFFTIRYKGDCILFGKDLEGQIRTPKRCPECIQLLKEI